jgi:hypothetical protein
VFVAFQVLLVRPVEGLAVVDGRQLVHPLVEIGVLSFVMMLKECMDSPDSKHPSSLTGLGGLTFSD